MKRFLISLYLLASIVGSFLLQKAPVFALDAYVSGGKISVSGDIYTDSGLVTVTQNGTYGWRYYLPEGFSCGDTIIVDNPDSPGMAQRKTTPNADIQNNIIPECMTVAANEVDLTIVSVAGPSQCNAASGIWTGSICSFDGSGFTLPLDSGRCYSVSGGSYKVVQCPATGNASPNCAIANTPPIPGYYTIDCSTGRTLTLDQNGDVVCGSTTEVDCMQADGRYRCWDGSVIAIARGSTCPLNALAIKKSTCVNSGGVWDDSLQGCTCESPLSLNGGVCVDPANVTATAETTTGTEELDGDCAEEVLTRENCGIINVIVVGINFLSAVAGIVFVVSVMLAGFQYMTARDNAGQVQKARNRIVMTIVALAIYIFMYALLNFLIPGGVLPA